MGSFYTATLYPKENNQDVKNILKGRNFYICSKNDNYNLVTEKQMDCEQNTYVILNFVKELSLKTHRPVISYLIHDSDVLYFVIYKEGREIFLITNEDEYFSDGEFIQRETEDVPTVFGIDEKEFHSEICKNKFEECIFADDFLLSILKVLNLPCWCNGIGYNYLEDDEDFKNRLESNSIKIEHYKTPEGL